MRYWVKKCFVRLNFDQVSKPELVDICCLNNLISSNEMNLANSFNYLTHV